MARARENALGRLPRYANRQDGRGDLRSQQSARLPQCRRARERPCRAAALGPDGKSITGAEATIAGERRSFYARIVILAAGAVNSAALLLASRDGGIANRSDAVGRHFMNHNCSAVLAIDPRSVNDSVYQKTIWRQRFLPRRRARRAAARQHPAAWPRDRRRYSRRIFQCAPEWTLNLFEPDAQSTGTR